MLRFLLTPRWIGLLLVVVVLGYACVRLSEWQFSRYAERKDTNSQVGQNLAAPAVPVGRLLTTRAEPSSSLEWREVTASGHYDAAHQIAVLYRTQDGQPGVDVVTPFVTSTGTAVLVDRGWMPSTANGNSTVHLPPPASGPVTLSGYVRVDSTGGSDETTPDQGAVRAISGSVIGGTLPYPVYDGFLQLVKESPRSPHAPLKAGKPSLSGGPSFFYGWQWLFFAALFLGFWFYFAWAEYSEKVLGKPRGRRPPPHPRPAGPPTPTPTPQDPTTERTTTESSRPG